MSIWAIARSAPKRPVKDKYSGYYVMRKHGTETGYEVWAPGAWSEYPVGEFYVYTTDPDEIILAGRQVVDGWLAKAAKQNEKWYL